MFRRIVRSTLALLLPFLMLTQDADAGPREKLGYGRLVTNDYFGDGSDRWRTGSISSSRIWGTAGGGGSGPRLW
jgi:hypothetical protein